MGKDYFESVNTPQKVANLYTKLSQTEEMDI